MTLRPERACIGTVEGRKIALGNAKMLADLGVEATTLESEADRLRRDGATVIVLAVDGKAAGILAVADPVKTTTPEALKKLDCRAACASSC